MIRNAQHVTVSEFESLSEGLGPCELIRGEVIQLSPGGPLHSLVTMNTAGLLWDWARRTGSGRTFTGETGVCVETDPDSVRGMDVAFYTYDRLPKGRLPEGYFTTPPSLAVEIAGKRQSWAYIVGKAADYLRMGADRVWIVDPYTRRMHVFSFNAEPTALSEHDTLEDPVLLPGFSCPVREFFAE